MGFGEESRDLSPASLELVRCLQGVLPHGIIRNSCLRQTTVTHPPLHFPNEFGAYVTSPELYVALSEVHLLP